MALLVSRNRPGCLDLINGSEILALFCRPDSPLSSVSTPCKISCFTEQPCRAALDLSWRYMGSGISTVVLIPGTIVPYLWSLCHIHGLEFHSLTPVAFVVKA
jgi:hypothetical protein